MAKNFDLQFNLRVADIDKSQFSKAALEYIESNSPEWSDTGEDAEDIYNIETDAFRFHYLDKFPSNKVKDEIKDLVWEMEAQNCQYFRIVKL